MAADPDTLRNLSYPKLDDQVYFEFNQVQSQAALGAALLPEPQAEPAR